MEWMGVIPSKHNRKQGFCMPSVSTRLLVLLMPMMALTGCEQPTYTHLEKVQNRGALIVGARNAGTTYRQGPWGPTGLEYELAQGFARQLGVDLEMRIVERFPDLLVQVRRYEVDLAAGLSITPRRTRAFRFGPDYQTIRPWVVYRKGAKRPRKVDDLDDGVLAIIADTNHEELLRHLRHNGHPKLIWKAYEDVDGETLMRWVQEKRIDYTIADSNEADLVRHFYPQLRLGFAIGEPETLAWAFPKDNDVSLRDEAAAYFQSLEASGALQKLLERHYGHLDQFNIVDIRDFHRHLLSRLPRYREAFEQHAATHGLDWRLLAAVGYQESHWNPRAVSPTGVRGLMMLTQATAKQMGVENREDPEQSIFGGAKYLAHMKKRIPDRIPEPDRTWLALASYNVGLGHLEDARILTRKAGLDPDRWDDVRRWLPKLSERTWHTQTRHGYARGHEPVVYVDRIRRYYDLVIRHDQNTDELPDTEPDKPRFPEMTPPATL